MAGISVAAFLAFLRVLCGWRLVGVSSETAESTGGWYGIATANGKSPCNCQKKELKRDSIKIFGRKPI